MGSTSDLRQGAVIEFKGDPCVILETSHRFMGRGSGFHQVKMRNLKTGRQFENKFRSSENITFLRLEHREYQYLYHDGVAFVFMNNDTYEQVMVEDAIVGESAEFLRENDMVKIAFSDDEIISVELPAHVTLKVVETEPGVRGDTVSNTTKPAKLETGASVQVPLFVNQGDVIRVDTRTRSYIERVKK